VARQTRVGDGLNRSALIEGWACDNCELRRCVVGKRNGERVQATSTGAYTSSLRQTRTIRREDKYPGGLVLQYCRWLACWTGERVNDEVVVVEFEVGCWGRGGHLSLAILRLGRGGSRRQL
jgi:hypothetical protein